MLLTFVSYCVLNNYLVVMNIVSLFPVILPYVYALFCFVTGIDAVCVKQALEKIVIWFFKCLQFSVNYHKVDGVCFIASVNVVRIEQLDGCQFVHISYAGRCEGDVSVCHDWCHQCLYSTARAELFCWRPIADWRLCLLGSGIGAICRLNVMAQLKPGNEYETNIFESRC